MSVTFTPKVLWVTQTQPRAGRTARRLKEMGFLALIGPLLRPNRSSTDGLSEKRSVLLFIAQLRDAISYLPRVDGILIYSSEASTRLARILSKHSWHGRVLCISQDCAARLKGIDALEILVAPKASEDALIDLARTVFAEPS